MKEVGHTKGTTTQMYADFEDTVDIEKEFPSIVITLNEPIFGKEDTKYLINFFNLPSLSQITERWCPFA